MKPSQVSHKSGLDFAEETHVFVQSASTPDHPAHVHNPSADVLPALCDTATHDRSLCADQSIVAAPWYKSGLIDPWLRLAYPGCAG